MDMFQTAEYSAKRWTLSSDPKVALSHFGLRTLSTNKERDREKFVLIKHLEPLGLEIDASMHQPACGRPGFSIWMCWWGIFAGQRPGFGTLRFSFRSSSPRTSSALCSEDTFWSFAGDVVWTPLGCGTILYGTVPCSVWLAAMSLSTASHAACSDAGSCCTAEKPPLNFCAAALTYSSFIQPIGISSLDQSTGWTTLKSFLALVKGS